MKYLRKYNEQLISIYDEKWESLLPDKLTTIKSGKIHHFEKGNIMVHSDMLQITYDTVGGEIWGEPDTLEFDIYFVKNGHIELTVDITYGDLVVSEFKLKQPNTIDVIQYTSLHSKFDPSNTLFALDNNSLVKFIEFLNRFGFNFTISDFKFLDKYDDYLPN